MCEPGRFDELTVRVERHLGEEEGRAARVDLLRRPVPTVALGPEVGPEQSLAR